MIKAIIFDIGGVLVSPKVGEIHNDIADYLGISRHRLKNFAKKYESSLAKGKISFFDVYTDAIKKFSLKKFTAQKIVNKHLKIFQKRIKKLNSKIISLIKNLRKKYRVLCLVNAETDVIPFVKKRGVYDYFGRVYISAQMGMEKPEKKIYLTVLNDLKLKPGEAVFIDDKKENVAMAKKIGIVGIRYKWGEDLEKKLRPILANK